MYKPKTKNQVTLLLITFTIFPSLAQTNEFKNCVKQYESFVDEHLNIIPAPKGKERAKIAMKGFEELSENHPSLSFDEIVKCSSSGTVASNSKSELTNTSENKNRK